MFSNNYVQHSHVSKVKSTKKGHNQKSSSNICPFLPYRCPLKSVCQFYFHEIHRNTEPFLGLCGPRLSGVPGPAPALLGARASPFTTTPGALRRGGHRYHCALTVRPSTRNRGQTLYSSLLTCISLDVEEASQSGLEFLYGSPKS